MKKSKKSRKSQEGFKDPSFRCGWNTNKKDKRRKTRQADLKKHLKEFGDDE